MTKGGDGVKKESKGFTLLEMTVVLVLICLLGVALVPSMKIVYRQEIRKAADILCADLMTIRKQAIATNVTYSLVVDSTEEYKYTISPGIIQSTVNKRTSNYNDSISPNIKYTITGKYEDGTTYISHFICYKDGKLVDSPVGTPSEVKELTIKVTYNGTPEYAEIIYDGFTGRYSITIKN